MIRLVTGGYSTAVAAVPVLVLLLLLAIGRVSAWKAALLALLSACCVAWLVFKMPAAMVLSSALMGLVFALLRIVWLIVAAVFLYEITVATGQFEIMKASVARLSADRRLQAVLVAFCFGAFIEGAAGFGAPVAISAAFLVGLGFDPFKAAMLVLDRQHGARGVGKHRHSDPDARHGHRARRRGVQRDFGANSAVPFALDPILAGAGDDELARDLCRLGTAGDHRRHFCRRAIPLVQLRGLRAG